MPALKTLSEKPPSGSALFTAVMLCCSALASRVLSAYLAWRPEPLVHVALFALLFVALRFRIHARATVGPWRGLCFFLFSALLSASILYGAHITITTGAYSALLDEAYISPFGMADILAFFLNAGSIYILATAGFLALEGARNEGTGRHRARITAEPNLARVSPRSIVLFAAILLVLWLPYLLTYWPGLIFNDSLNSIAQSMGWEPLRNHHPVAYTLLIKVCLKIARTLGFGNSVGCAIYSLFQMTFMAGCLSFASCWIATRTNIKAFAPALVALLGLSPYIATYTVAMWKDPLFSVALVVVSLLLCDLVLIVRRDISAGAPWYIGYVTQLTVMTFVRSNGVYISLLVLCAAVVLALTQRRKNEGSQAFVTTAFATGAVVVASFLVTGPLYQLIGVAPASRAESLGVPLNQMARVAALNGDMTDSDRAYMDELLPIGLYESTYRPCCTDLLKWDEHFNASALDHRIVGHWLSMLVRNPGAYIDAWVLQTFGWWTINQPDVINYQRNIAQGAQNNGSPEKLASYGIVPRNLLGTETAREIFPMDEWAFPIGWVAWSLAYLCLCTFVSRRNRTTLLALVPSVGLVATLLVASPIWYWPRYAFALQLLIPFYGALFLWLRFSRRSTQSPMKDGVT